MRILIADDDEISRRFLAEACKALGCEYVTVPDGAQAFAAAIASRFDVLLLDIRMPYMGGSDLLGALRARGIDSRAIATSAELDHVAREELLEAGFCDALNKPVSIERLAQAIGAKAVSESTPTITDFGRLFDDASALASVGGDWPTLQALRKLLAQELRVLVEDLTADTSSSQMLDRLHRLRASCGFCGAAALAEAALEFQNALNDGGERLTKARETFTRACNATRIALIQSDEPAEAGRA